MKLLSTLFLAASAAIVAPVAADTGKTEPLTIIDLLAADGKYGTLISAATNTPGALDTVTASFPVTIFAPTDAAFAAAADTIAQLEAEQGCLSCLLAGHVLQGVFTAQMVIDAGCVELENLSGNKVRVMVMDGKVMVNDATVIQPDIIGEGGVSHGIDKVILPGTFQPCPTAAPVAAPSGKGKGGSKGMSSKKSGKGGSKGMSSKKAGKGGKGASSKGMSGKGGKGGSSKGTKKASSLRW